MITDAICGFFLTAFRSVVGLLPKWSPSIGALTGSAESIGQAAAQANGWFPVALLGISVVAIAGMQVFLLAWRGIVFVYELIPFKMT